MIKLITKLMCAPLKKERSSSFFRRSMLLAGLLLVSFVNIYAQSKVITGTVIDEFNEPLTGASISVQGTTKGTIADIDGKYNMSVDQGDIVVYSFLGMETQTVTIAGQSVIDIKLMESANVLQETVVIGYGSAKAKDLTSPIAVIKGEELSKHLTTSPMQSMQGKVSGVQVIGSGQPGSSPKVRIRGLGNMDNSKQNPLYVVDGMFFDNIDFLSNDDIESLNILKDASSAAIYGVRAANGVVLITTKKGIKGRAPQITYDGYVGFQKATNVMKMANSEQYATIMNDMAMSMNPSDASNLLKSINSSINLWGGSNGIPSTNTNWYDELLKTALMHSHSLSITGGSDKTSYSIGANYLNQEGIMDVENGYERVNVRTKLDTEITSWLNVGANLIFTNSSKQENSGNAWLAAYHNPSIYPVYDQNRSYEDQNQKIRNPHNFASPDGQIGMSNFFNNPVAIATYGQNKTLKSTRILPSFYLDFNFLDRRLNLKSTFSQDINIERYREFIPSYYVSDNHKRQESYLNKRMQYFNNWILDNVVTFRDNIDKHSFSAMIGNSVRQEKNELLRAEANGVPEGLEEYWYIYNGTQILGKTEKGQEDNWPDKGEHYEGLSYFSRLTYDYDGKYLLSATFRADGSSKYYEKWGYFPSIGLGWVASEESFVKDLNIFDFLKLRANWGKLGNDKIDRGVPTVVLNNQVGIWNGDRIPGVVGLGYPEKLRWEVVEEYDFGLDFNILNDRLSVNFDYFNRTTHDAVFSQTIPLFGGTRKVNTGEIENKGFELSLNWNDRIGKDFGYNIGFNGTILNNKVTALGNSPIQYNANNIQANIVGEKMNSFYGYKVIGVYQNEEELKNDPIAVANGLQVGDFKYWDKDGDNVLTAGDRTVLGSPVPDYTIGGNIGANYKNFDFNLAFQGTFGAEIYNKKREARTYQSAINYDKDWADNIWTKANPTNSYPSARGSNDPWNISKVNSFFVESANTFTIQNIQFGYTFKNIVKTVGRNSSLRLSLTAERPFSFFSYNGFSTDVSDGIDTNTYPLASTYSFGLKLVY